MANHDLIDLNWAVVYSSNALFACMYFHRMKEITERSFSDTQLSIFFLIKSFTSEEMNSTYFFSKIAKDKDSSHISGLKTFIWGRDDHMLTWIPLALPQ